MSTRQVQQLERVIQEQRLQLFFASRLWLEVREENLHLREQIFDLRRLLEDAGINNNPPPNLDAHPLLPLVYDPNPEKVETRK